MKQISKSQFKPKALEYMRHVEQSGEPLIITDRGKPTLELRPVQADSIKEDPMTYLQGVIIDYVGPMEPVAEDDWDQDQ